MCKSTRKWMLSNARTTRGSSFAPKVILQYEDTSNQAALSTIAASGQALSRHAPTSLHIREGSLSCGTVINRETPEKPTSDSVANCALSTAPRLLNAFVSIPSSLWSRIRGEAKAEDTVRTRSRMDIVLVNISGDASEREGRESMQ